MSEPTTVDLTVDEARESVERTRGGLEVAANEVVRQINGRAWLALGYESWDEMREGEYGGAAVIVPRADRPQLSARLATEGLGQSQIAATLGVSQATVSGDLKAVIRTDNTGSDLPEVRTDSLGREQPRAKPRPEPAPSPFVCDECGESFGVNVWHCKCCDHHWSRDLDDTCKNCISVGCATCLAAWGDEPDDEPDADLLAGQIWTPAPPPAPAPVFQPARPVPRPMPAPPAFTPREREEHIRLVAKQSHLNAYSGAVDGLIALESYAAAYTPPVEIPGHYPALPAVIRRIEAVLSTWKNWNATR